MLSKLEIEGSDVAIENARANIKWAEYFKKDLESYFKPAPTTDPSKSTTKGGAITLTINTVLLGAVLMLLYNLF